MQREYEVVGTQPVRIPGTKTYAEPGSKFKADPKDVAFPLQVNAIAEAKSSPKGSAKKSAKKTARKSSKKRQPFNTDAKTAPARSEG